MPTRRTFLAGLGGAVGSVTLAGCSGFPFGSDDVEYDDWIPDQDDDAILFQAAHPSTLVDVESLPEGYLGEQLLGVDHADVDLLVRFGSPGEVFQGTMATVIEGQFEASVLHDDLESELDGELEQTGEYEGFQRLVPTDSEVTVGLRDGGMLVTSTANFESIVDARSGNGTRLFDAHDDASMLDDTVGQADVVDGSIRLDDEAESLVIDPAHSAEGNGIAVDEEVTEGTHATIYRDEDAVDEDAVLEQFQADDALSDLSSERDGRVVTVTWTQETGSL